jgi:predicted phage terminase large subunit-like protein
MFQIVKYPAINDRGDEYILPDDNIMELPPGSTVPAGSVMTRPQNTALHPARYTYESLMKRRASYYALGQQRWWAALYQQNPTPEEGAYFTKNMFQTYEGDLNLVGKNIYQAWDFAITEGEANDWTVGCTILQDEHDNLYVLDVYRFRCGDGMDIIDTVIEYAKKWQPSIIGFEDGQIWKALASTFTKTCAAKQYYPSYEILKPFTDKFVRAQPLRGRMQAKKMFWPAKAPWYDECRTEFLKFGGGGKHDDQIDSVAWCVRLMLSKSAPRAAAPRAEKSWRDRLNYSKGGASHMAS